MNSPEIRSPFRTIAAGILSLAAIALCGCESVAGSTPQTLVRVIDASANASGVDVYDGSTALQYNVGEATITGYAYVGPGNATLSIHPAGKSTVSSQIAADLAASQQYSVYLTDSGTGYAATLLTDQNTPAPSGNISVRFLDQASAAGPVDVYFIPDGTKLTAAKPVLTAFAPASASTYLSIPVGTWDLVVVPTGVTALKSAYVSTPTVYTSGQVRTMLIVDQSLSSAPPVNVIVGDDLD
jgi:Domain of unknown function (DUF4397)